MTIYTRTGDDGTTSLFGGKRILKSDPVIKACGDIDELTSFIGLVIAKLKKTDNNRKLLVSIQEDLYQIMAVLVGAKIKKVSFKKRVLFFEKKIDSFSDKLSQLNDFIIPGGNELSSWFHVLRTVCRRCERDVVFLKIKNLPAQQYLNRLSDLFFILARFYGKDFEVVLKNN